MSTRFYAGPLSHGMGRRWDDWSEPEHSASTPARGVAPKPPAPPLAISGPTKGAHRSVLREAASVSAPRVATARADRTTPAGALVSRA